jgi:hypothetical protein
MQYDAVSLTRADDVESQAVDKFGPSHGMNGHGSCSGSIDAIRCSTPLEEDHEVAQAVAMIKSGNLGMRAVNAQPVVGALSFNLSGVGPGSLPGSIAGGVGEFREH